MNKVHMLDKQLKFVICRPTVKFQDSTNISKFVTCLACIRKKKMWKW